MAIQTINQTTNKLAKSFDEMSELGLGEFVNKKLIRISELSDPF